MKSLLRTTALGVALLSLVACAGQPISTAESRIVAACTQTGLFETVDGRIAVAVKEARMPIAVINAGLDRICADPAALAHDAAAVAAIIQALAAVHR